MRKALLPMVASLLLCGVATAALIATNAHADQAATKKPVMVALATAPNLPLTAAPRGEDGGAMDAMPMDHEMMGGPGMGLARLCQDMVARRTGELAYLEAKLSLTSAQAPLYARWKSVMLDIAQKRSGECAAFPRRAAGEKRTLLDGMALEEKLLKARLADLEAERPALTALYNALNPEQQAELGRAARHKMAGRMHLMMGMMNRPGMMGHAMGRGPDGPGAPPPPPAQ